MILDHGSEKCFTMVEEAISIMTEKNKDLLTEEVTSLITFWNDLYGNIMYRVAIPAREDKLFKLVCDRIGDYGYTAIRQAIIRIGFSRYLLGRLDQPPVSIYWFLNSKNLRKVLDGNYDDYSAAKRREGITRDLAARHIRHIAGDSGHAENTDNSTGLAPASPPAYSSAAFPSEKNRGLEHDADLDAWLIDQIVHKKLHDLPPAPENCTDWEAYMNGD